MSVNDEESRGLSAYAPHIAVRACGRLWRLDRAADLETLWNAMCDDPDADDERHDQKQKQLLHFALPLCRNAIHSCSMSLLYVIHPVS